MKGERSAIQSQSKKKNQLALAANKIVRALSSLLLLSNQIRQAHKVESWNSYKPWFFG